MVANGELIRGYLARVLKGRHQPSTGFKTKTVASGRARGVVITIEASGPPGSVGTRVAFKTDARVRARRRGARWLEEQPGGIPR